MRERVREWVRERVNERVIERFRECEGSLDREIDMERKRGNEVEVARVFIGMRDRRRIKKLKKGRERDEE